MVPNSTTPTLKALILLLSLATLPHQSMALSAIVTGGTAAAGAVATALLARIAHTRAAKMRKLKNELNQLRIQMALVTPGDKATPSKRITTLEDALRVAKTVREDTAIGATLTAVVSAIAALHAGRNIYTKWHKIRSATPPENPTATSFETPTKRTGSNSATTIDSIALTELRDERQSPNSPDNNGSPQPDSHSEIHQTAQTPPKLSGLKPQQQENEKTEMSRPEQREKWMQMAAKMAADKTKSPSPSITRTDETKRHDGVHNHAKPPRTPR